MLWFAEGGVTLETVTKLFGKSVIGRAPPLLFTAKMPDRLGWVNFG